VKESVLLPQRQQRQQQHSFGGARAPLPPRSLWAALPAIAFAAVCFIYKGGGVETVYHPRCITPRKNDDEK
jgi:hypothetical protein